MGDNARYECSSTAHMEIFHYKTGGQQLIFQTPGVDVFSLDINVVSEAI